jgi:hypothetical protein
MSRNTHFAILLLGSARFCVGTANADSFGNGANSSFGIAVITACGFWQLPNAASR